MLLVSLMIPEGEEEESSKAEKIKEKYQVFKGIDGSYAHRLFAVTLGFIHYAMIMDYSQEAPREGV